MQPIEIFKVGTHTAMNGQTLPFDRNALVAAVAAYKPDLHEAPIVVGHPKDNHPAFGWIDHLELTDDGVVLAHPKEVDADFAELVKAGRYKKRSASWYTADSPANPTPGTLYLRHVGFLGAQPPALKGLGDVQFNEAEEGVLEFGDTSPYVFSILGDVLRSMREWFIGKEGLEAADQIIRNYQIDELTAEAERQSRSVRESLSTVNSFSEGHMSTQNQETPEQKIARLQQENADLKANSKTVDFSEKEQQFVDREAALAKREVTAKIDDLVAAGKVLPTQKTGLVEFMASLGDDAQVIEFGEGDQAKKQSPRQFMTDFLNSMPNLVEFGEVAGNDNGGQAAGDMSADELGKKARAYHQKQADAGVSISFTEAVAAIQAGQE